MKVSHTTFKIFLKNSEHYFFYLQRRRQVTSALVGGWGGPSSQWTTGAGQPRGQGSVSVG